MAGNPSIGTREYGKRAIRERWYTCAILGEVVPMSQTVVPSHPHPHAGQRVCMNCYDEKDYNMNRVLAPPRVSDTEGLP